jgi:hypothetical protein
MLDRMIRPSAGPAIGRLAFGLACFLGCAGLARAQDPPSPSTPAFGADVPSTAPSPVPAGPGYGGTTLAPSAPGGPVMGDAVPQCPPGGDDGSIRCPGPDEHGLFRAAIGSIFGHYDSSCFTPLGLSNFFEGWLTPWIPVGNGSSGAARGGWVGEPGLTAGFFRREFDPTFTWIHGTNGSPNSQEGGFLLFLPLSRRFELSFFMPYVDSVNPGNSSTGGRSTSFGDTLITGRVMLIENKDFGWTSGLEVLTPTGSTSTGNGQTALTPFTEFWADVGGAWQVRGGMNVMVPVANNVLPTSNAVLDADLGIGKTFQTPLGELTPHMFANFFETFNKGPLSDVASLQLTPGVRAQLFKSKNFNSFLLWGLTVPVTGPLPFATTNQFIWVNAW